MTTIRSRGWVFTINNYSEIDLANINLLSTKTQYLIYGSELGENNTPHYQGYCYFKNARDFNCIKNLLPRAHIEKQRGNNHEAIEYCKKDGLWTEIGQKPENADQTSKWRSIIELAENGNLSSIKSENPRIYFMYLEKIKSLRIPTKIILQTLDHEWWYGPTGTGKSMKLWAEYPNHYMKQINKWWDGYEQQDVVAIEEWSPKNECTASSLKVWADRYPFAAQIKNGTLHGIRPLKIIVTSNYTIDECFPNAQDAEPLKRRFNSIYFPRTPFTDLDLNDIHLDIDALLNEE